MAILAFFAPISETAPVAPANFLPAGSFSCCAMTTRGRAFEMQPGEITRPAADERLRKGEEHDQQARVDGVELRLDPRAQHVGERDAERAAKHQIGHDPQRAAEKLRARREKSSARTIRCC